jgi:hypothetical protein
MVVGVSSRHRALLLHNSIGQSSIAASQAIKPMYIITSLLQYVLGLVVTDIILPN